MIATQIEFIIVFLALTVVLTSIIVLPLLIGIYHILKYKGDKI